MLLGGEGSLKVMDLYELSLGKECVWPNGTHSPNQSDQSVMQSLTHSSTYQSNFIQALSFSYNIFYISLKQWSFSCCFNLCIISFAVFSHTLRKKVYVQTCSGLVTAGNMADDSRFPRLSLLSSFYRSFRVYTYNCGHKLQRQEI